MAAPKRIGLLVGHEWSFPPAFLEEVNGRDAGVLAEYIKLGGTLAAQPLEYDLILDRISHQVPFYRTVLKHAALHGTRVINDPFRWSADDKFAQSSLAISLNIPTPRTVALPMKRYASQIGRESLRNLMYPLDWEALAAYVGLPAILKDISGVGDRRVFCVNSVEELLKAYDSTGELCMILQEYIETKHFVHCFSIGLESALAVRYDPNEQCYVVDEQPAMQDALYRQIIDYTQQLNQALGYDVNCVEFAIQKGTPYAIDMLNPAPEIDVNRMTPRHFDWMVQALADFAIQSAFAPIDTRT